jgi:integrase
MRDTGLLTCPRTGQDRTLYSLRHTYATFSLLNDGMDVHTLAVQMGTSILMIERHYSHLTPRLKKKCSQASAMTRRMMNTSRAGTGLLHIR